MDEERNFIGTFEALFTKTLIDHSTISKNCPKVDGLTKWIV